MHQKWREPEDERAGDAAHCGLRVRRGKHYFPQSLVSLNGGVGNEPNRSPRKPQVEHPRSLGHGPRQREKSESSWAKGAHGDRHQETAARAGTASDAEVQRAVFRNPAEMQGVRRFSSHQLLHLLP